MGESREVTRELHAKGDEGARGGKEVPPHAPRGFAAR